MRVRTGYILMPALDPQSLPGHTDRLYRAALALCGSRQDAEDLVQETFAKVLARRRVLRDSDEAAYLMRTLRNTFLTGRRTASRRPRLASIAIEELQPVDPRRDERPEDALQVREVLATIATLSEDQRLALVAVELMGLSHREAARALGTREATIATRIFRARERLARDLADETPAATESQAAPLRARVPPARDNAREGPAPVRSLLQRGPT
ncbi:MAG TPA: RNA polymerase sigma factor [Solirubrobacteraceae bacterium]|nr:RNA polymerase sigma factor [Solirubrobacteraceae bacterium]